MGCVVSLRTVATYEAVLGTAALLLSLLAVLLQSVEDASWQDDPDAAAAAAMGSMVADSVALLFEVAVAYVSCRFRSRLGHSNVVVASIVLLVLIAMPVGMLSPLGRWLRLVRVVSPLVHLSVAWWMWSSRNSPAVANDPAKYSLLTGRRVGPPGDAAEVEAGSGAAVAGGDAAAGGEESTHKVWLWAVSQMYACCIVFVFVAALIYAELLAESELVELESGQSKAALSMWLLFSTFHGASFGDVTPRTPATRFLVALVCFVSYLFIVASMTAARLAGHERVTAGGVAKRVARASWPSCLAVLVLLMVVAFAMADQFWPVLTEDGEAGAVAYGESLYFCTTLLFRASYGDMLPATHLGKVISVAVSLGSALYAAFIVAAVAPRRVEATPGVELTAVP